MKPVLNKRHVLIVAFLSVCIPVWCQAMTVTELKKAMDQKGRITLVDIRKGNEYALGHIPNAINIPSKIILHKPFPPLGRVIVYGDGIQTAIALEAADALNTKMGIQAEILEGGFPAWVSMDLPSTQKRGMRREQYKYISYIELQRASEMNQNIVLVDMRPLKELKKNSGTGSGDALSDLSAKFPGLRIISLDQSDLRQGENSTQISVARVLGAQKTGHEMLLVLVGSGDGEAEKAARRMHAAGIKPVWILTGGERILKRDGQPGFGAHVTGE